MIISKTPVRISIGGGGTDLPSFYSRFGSFFISAAINKYIYIIVQERRYYDDFVIKYSKTEITKDVNKIQNEIVRECLKLLKINTPLEIVSISDVGGLSGLGSSGAFTVGLLNALHAFKKEAVSREQLAEEACTVAIDILNCPSGKQDEYISTFGGFTSFRINKKGKVNVLMDDFDENFIRELEHYLYMFYTGINRESKAILDIQKGATENNDQQVINNLNEVQKLGKEIRKALKNKNSKLFGELLHKHWYLKRERDKTTNPKLDKWYKLARQSGAAGGKIMGAGGGGFFLFYCDKNAPSLINKLTTSGLRNIPFHFDYSGSKLVANL